jgi:hypothetical protein
MSAEAIGLVITAHHYGHGIWIHRRRRQLPGRHIPLPNHDVVGIDANRSSSGSIACPYLTHLGQDGTFIPSGEHVSRLCGWRHPLINPAQLSAAS